MKDSKRLLCSVCIANFNGEHLLRDCIDSVLAQITELDIEVIVHDDASTDASVAFLRSSYPQIRLIESEKNVGFCVSNNRMAREARGEFILLLNNDAALLPGAVQVLWEMARLEEKKGILTLPQYQWDTGELVDRGCLLDPFYNPIPNYDPTLENVALAIGACLWIPRSLWLELDGFPEWMNSIGEDLFLCCLARSLGYTVRAAPHSGFRHRLGSSFGGARVTGNTLRTTFRRRALSERNKTFVLIAFTQGIACPLLLAIHLMALLCEGLVLATLRRDLRVFTSIYLNVPVQVIKRRAMLAQLHHDLKLRRQASTRQFYSAFKVFPRKLLMLHRFGVPKIE